MNTRQRNTNNDIHHPAKLHINCGCVSMLLLCCLLTGCGTVRRQAITMDMDAVHSIDTPIYIMPIIDARTNRSVEFNDDDSKHLQTLAAKKLKKMGYDVRVVHSWDRHASAEMGHLLDMNTEEICEIMSPNAPVSLVITLNNLRDSYKVLTTSFSITATMSLYDVQQRKEIWQDAAIGEHGGGGILDAALAQIGKRSSAYSAFMNTVFMSLPAHEEKWG